MTLAEEKAKRRTKCDDMVEIQTDRSVLPAAHIWPEDAILGDTCNCGEWYWMGRESGGMMIVKTFRVKE